MSHLTAFVSFISFDSVCLIVWRMSPTSPSDDLVSLGFCVSMNLRCPQPSLSCRRRCWKRGRWNVGTRKRSAGLSRRSTGGSPCSFSMYPLSSPSQSTFFSHKTFLNLVFLLHNCMNILDMLAVGSHVSMKTSFFWYLSILTLHTF